jgi:hypothetical protein
LVIVAPTLGLATGAFLALRVVPAAARWAERSVVGTRGAAPALTGWQLARRPHRYARSALLLIMSLAIGTFAVAYDATWTVSQQAQAAHEIGADGRVEPNRRTGDSVGPMQLPSLIEQVPGVDVVTPVVKGSVELPGSDRGGAFVAVAADRSEALGESIEAGVAAAMASLRDARADVAGLGLPAGARGIELSVSVSDPDATADPPSVADGAEPTSDDDAAETPPPPEPFVASLAVVIVDRGGTPRRLDAGLIEPGANSVEIPLAIGGASGFEASPSGPVSLTGFEISTTSQPTPPREVAITLGPLVIDTGDSAGVMLPVLQSSFVTETDVLGFVDGRPAIGFGGDAPDDGVGLTVTTGSASFGTVPIIHGVVVRDAEFPTEVPAAATSTWLTASRTEIGDVVPVSLGRADDVRIRIVASVDAVPTVDPALVDGLLVDLPSLMAVEYRPGQTEREMTEYWFSVDPDTELSPGALLEPPVSATAVELTADRAEELVDNAAALGAIGALSLGFVAAAAFAVVGFAVTTMVSVSERRSEFRLLRAIGLTGRQHRRWMLAEQSLLALVGIGLGVLLGWLLAVMILPVVSLAQDGSEVYPPVEAVVPWARVTVLILAVVVGLLLGAVFTATHDRRAQGEAMRAGGDT